jgi:putative membrane protein
VVSTIAAQFSFQETDMRRLTIVLLGCYAALTAYTLLGGYLGMRFHPIFTPLLSLLAYGFALLHAGQRLGWARTVLFLGLTFGVSLLFESVGVATGWVYGPYHYTDHLGPRFLGLVPYLIPIAWFMMMYPSYVIAIHIVPTAQRLWCWRLSLAALGAFIMTAWDLVMDPLMVAMGHWVWEVDGAYFGVPVQNYLGWWLTTFTTFALFVLLGRLKPSKEGHLNPSFDRLAILSYAITDVGNILANLRGGMGGPALVGLFAMTPWVAIAWWNTSHKR